MSDLCLTLSDLVQPFSYLWFGSASEDNVVIMGEPLSTELRNSKQSRRYHLSTLLTLVILPQSRKHPKVHNIRRCK